MATLVSAGPAIIWLNGKKIGEVRSISLPDPMVKVTLGGTYPDGTSPIPVDIEAPRSIVEQGGQAVFDWWIEDLKAKEAARLLTFNEVNEDGSVFLPGSIVLPPTRNK